MHSQCTSIKGTHVHVSMRDEKEGRKKQARSNKQRGVHIEPVAQ